MRILIVDNDAHTRDTLCQFLVEEGHDAICEASGSNALQRFREEPFPLVILDQVLVGMDGLDLLARIKAEKPETLVIVTSSFPALAAVVRALRLDAFDYLVKTDDDFDQLRGSLIRATAQIGEQLLQRENLDHLHMRVTTLQEENRRLTSSSRDSSTGLDETDQFITRMQAEIDRSGRYQRHFSLVMLRFNPEVEIGSEQFHLKAVEGSLPTLVQKVRERLRQSDILARYDENTLSLILPETGREGAMQVAKCIAGLCGDIVAALLGTEETTDGLLQVGIACFPEDGREQKDLVDLACSSTTAVSSESIH